MRLFELKSNKLLELPSKKFSLERDIQIVIENNIEDLFNLELVTTEFSLGEFRFDTLCFNNQTNSFVIIEYKNKHSRSVIDQGYSYLISMLDNKSEVIQEYNEVKNRSLRRGEVDWSSTKIIFVSPSFDVYQKKCVTDDCPFELYEIKNFDEKMLLLQKIKPTSSQKVHNFVKDKTTIVRVSSEIKSYKESDHTEKFDEHLQRVWFEIRDKLSQYDDSDFNPQKNYIQFQKNTKGVCYFKFRNGYLQVQLLGGIKYKNGKKSKNTISFDDPKKKLNKKVINYSNGNTQSVFTINIKKPDEIDYLESLIKQKYNSL